MSNVSRRFIAYFSVSTDKQGQSGLGLDAQRKAVTDYLNGGAWDLLAEYTEVESGKRADRPELLKSTGGMPATESPACYREVGSS